MSEQHDKSCELYGGSHTCKCWLRACGPHPALTGVREWQKAQHPADQSGIQPYIEEMEERLHRVDRAQEELKGRMRP